MVERLTSLATRFRQRLEDRYSWFQNDWFFKWSCIRGSHPVVIGLFDGRNAHYANVKFAGSTRDVFWYAIQKGMRKEVIDQMHWIEDSVNVYSYEIGARAIDECEDLLIRFVMKIRRRATEIDRRLRGDGLRFPEAEDSGSWCGASIADIKGQAEALKMALLSPRIETIPKRPISSLLPTNIDNGSDNIFQVALSFAGEQRAYVEEVAIALKEMGVSVFYDKFESSFLWGKDGFECFDQIFSERSKYVVMFISAEYVSKGRTTHERRAALSRYLNASDNSILPVRFDDSLVPGLPKTIQYVLAKEYNPSDLAKKIYYIVNKQSKSPV